VGVKGCCFESCCYKNTAHTNRQTNSDGTVIINKNLYSGAAKWWWWWWGVRLCGVVFAWGAGCELFLSPGLWPFLPANFQHTGRQLVFTETIIAPELMGVCEDAQPGMHWVSHLCGYTLVWQIFTELTFLWRNTFRCSALRIHIWEISWLYIDFISSVEVTRRQLRHGRMVNDESQRNFEKSIAAYCSLRPETW
jgi:hypothetical protein